MKINKFITLLVCLYITTSLFSQSIRKDYNEMTDSEKQLYVNALYIMRDLNGDGTSDSNPNDDDLILDIANFHNDNFINMPSAIHFNLPNNPEREVFLAWHRYMNFELEQAMQSYVNPKLSIPFWDWTTDRSTTDPLWDENFMGQFNSNWNLNRRFSRPVSSLPIVSEVEAAQSINTPRNNLTSFQNYSNSLERGKVHTGGHIWIGGTMASGSSPLDPMFHLHHGNIDKLWEEWQQDNPGLSSFIRQDMPRYNGSYTFNGTTLPSINPESIIDSKSLGVFYAKNGLSELYEYQVSNEFNPTETFYYQYRIEVKDNFIVPSGRSCLVESVNKVDLKAGFHAQAGSTFTAKIDTDNNIVTLGRHNIIKKYKNPFIDNLDDVYSTYLEANVKETDKNLRLKLYPNPTKDLIYIESETEIAYLELHSNLGTKINFKGVSYSNSKAIELNMNNLSSGIYTLKVIFKNGNIITKKVVKE